MVLSACGGGSNAPRAEPAPPATNDDGSVTTAILEARFDPSSAVVPFPTNLLFSGTDDLTLNIPIDDPSAPEAGPLIALNSLDGWSTTATWSTSFDGRIDESTVVPGQSVRWFEVQLNQPGGAPIGIVRELVPGVDFVTTVSASDPDQPSIVLVPLRPLDEITSYMVVITDDVTDTRGNDATPSQVYFLAQRTSPLVDAQGQSTDPLLDNATARALEPLRQLTNAQEAVAASAGIPRSEIVISWVATTQSITTVTSAAASLAGAQFSQFAPTPIDTSFVGGAGIADISIGIMSIPYYLDAPSASNPTAPLTTFWEAEPGAYVPPFDQLGFNPNSTNITYLNPFPRLKSTQNIPVLVTTPNAGSGMAKPDSGWPVVIFAHGLTRNRLDMLAIADSMALAGFATIAIDFPAHGIGSTIDPTTGDILSPANNPLYIENTPFGAIASERTFDVDFVNNRTGAPGPDGAIDASGATAINLQNLRVIRDGFRQAAVDHAALARTIPTMDLDGDGTPDFDGARIRFIGQSLGSLQGVQFLAVEPTVQVGVLNVTGASPIAILLTSPTFSPRVLAGLAQAGIRPGTDAFNQFVFAAQTIVDPGDPINWAEAATTANDAILAQLVLADQVVPNTTPGFPLGGGEPLVRELGLAPISETTQSTSGIKGVTRFIAGDHGSLLSPAASLEVTAEMQGEAASFFASGGRVIQVTIPSVLQGN
ncbi:MAG: hypothetical protein R3200_11905 [Xanthomonadales bacterium]|nr:hypothetical protein [Xanthomonadales bacterium]